MTAPEIVAITFSLAERECNDAGSIVGCAFRHGFLWNAGGRSKSRQGHLRHQLGGAARAWRLLSGARRRHLQEIRARRHHPARRAELQQSHPAAGRQDRLLHERQSAAVVRRGGAEGADRRGRRELSERPAGVPGASRSGHRKIRGPEEAEPAGLQGRPGRLLSMAEKGFRLHRQAGAAVPTSTRSRSSPTSAWRCRAM